MIHRPIQMDANIATKARMFNPFGPNMFYLSLHDRFVKELLGIVNKLDSKQDIKDKLDSSGQVIHGTNAVENQKNSIVDGQMYPIHPEYVEDGDNNAIIDVITNLTLLYAGIANEEVRSDVSLEDYPDAIELLEVESKEFQVKIEGIWYVKMKQGDFHILHEHSASGATLAGAIYLDMPDDIPWPQGNMNWIPPGGPQTMYNGTWQAHPKSGDVFIWPAWLLHTVYPFRSDKTRTMISFNSIILSPKKKKKK